MQLSRLIRREVCSWHDLKDEFAQEDQIMRKRVVRLCMYMLFPCHIGVSVVHLHVCVLTGGCCE